MPSLARRTITGNLLRFPQDPALKAGSFVRELPWRYEKDPYKILVSEIMLQQTQISRVLDYYPRFLKKFPTLSALRKAKIKDVLIAWQGLGYNRRAIALHRIAQTVRSLPRTIDELEALPGIGAYTAAAILVFAYNEPHVMIETNIRRVFIHEFFLGRQSASRRIHDGDIMPLIERFMDRVDPRTWYYKLMDLGAALSRTVPNPNRRSVHYSKQSPFEGSVRQKRAKRLRQLLTSQKNLTLFLKKEYNYDHG